MADTGWAQATDMRFAKGTEKNRKPAYPRWHEVVAQMNGAETKANKSMSADEILQAVLSH